MALKKTIRGSHKESKGKNNKKCKVCAEPKKTLT